VRHHPDVVLAYIPGDIVRYRIMYLYGFQPIFAVVATNMPDDGELPGPAGGRHGRPAAGSNRAMLGKSDGRTAASFRQIN
jgi:hypothetical protein